MKLTDFKTAILISNLGTPVGPFPACDAKEIHVYKDGDNIHERDGRIKTNKVFKPQAKERLYFDGSCKILRQKVRDWGKVNNASITVKKEDATAYFIGNRAGIVGTKRARMNRYEKELIIKFLELNYEDDMDVVIKMINNAESDYVFVLPSLANNPWFYSIGGNTQLGIKTGLGDIDPETANHRHRFIKHGVTFADKKMFANLAELFYSDKVYHQDHLTKLIHEHLVVIDDAMYRQFDNMLSTKSKDDMSVILECMANCNLEKSMFKIMLLIKNHWNNINNFKESKHTNFKSLINFLDLPNLYDITFDHMIDAMIAQDFLTASSLKELMPYVKEEMQKMASSKHFRIKTLVCEDTIIGVVAPHLLKKDDGEK